MTELASCTACTAAAQRVSHLFHADCHGCCARACARGQDFQRVRKAGALDHRYRLALQQFSLTHDEVKALRRVLQPAVSA